MDPALLSLIAPKNKHEFLALWSALTQYIENCPELDPGEEKNSILLAAEALQERFDWAAMKDL